MSKKITGYLAGSWLVLLPYSIGFSRLIKFLLFLKGGRQDVAHYKKEVFQSKISLCGKMNFSKSKYGKCF